MSYSSVHQAEDCA